MIYCIFIIPFTLLIFLDQEKISNPLALFIIHAHQRRDFIPAVLCFEQIKPVLETPSSYIYIMVPFDAPILRFEKNGEKTGWTYIEIPPKVLKYMFRRNRKAFRVKGMLDMLKISRVSVLPTLNKTYIMPINATLRKALKKKEGDTIKAVLFVDNSKVKIDRDLWTCLIEEPGAANTFLVLTQSQQNYFNNWVIAAKTPQTKADRIWETVNAMMKKMKYADMLRERKARAKKIF